MAKKKPPVKHEKALQRTKRPDNPSLIVEPRCRVCRHSKVSEINDRILDQSITQKRIAEKFGVSTSSIKRHFINHLSIGIRNQEIERQKGLKLEVQIFDDITYFNTLDKVKYAQEKIAKDLKDADQDTRVSLYGSWLKYIQIEAKLLNLYDIPQDDQIHQINKRCAHLTLNHLRQSLPKQEVKDLSSPQLVDKFQKDSQITAEQITSAFNFIYGVDLSSPTEVVRILSQNGNQP